MKKIACLSAVAACVLAVSAGTAFAGQSTVSAGYAQGDFQGVANKADGFNLKYRYEFDNNPLGVIGSFTHLEKDGSQGGFYNKAQYNSISAGQHTASMTGRASMVWLVWVTVNSLPTLRTVLLV